MQGSVASFSLADGLSPFVHCTSYLLKQQSIFPLYLCAFVFKNHILFAIVESSWLVIESSVSSIWSDVFDSIKMAFHMSLVLFFFEDFLPIVHASYHKFIYSRGTLS